METPSSLIGSSGIRENLTVVWRHKWIVFVSAAVITSIALAATIFFNTPKYQSYAELLQTHSGIDRALVGTDILQQSSYQPDRDMQNAAELVKSPEVVDAVYKKLGDEVGGQDLLSMINVSLVDKTDIMRITATSTDPQIAADVAGAFSTEYISWRQKSDQQVLENARTPIEEQLRSIPPEEQESTTYKVLADKAESLKLIQAMQTGNLEIVKPATLSGTPVARNPFMTGFAALFSSLIVGIGLVFTVEKFDTKVRDSTEITRRIEKPILASVPRIPSGNGNLVTLDNPSGASSEAYRLLKTNLSYIEPDREIKTIMVTSPEPGEGKSTTISNLAITLARAGQRVIILEGDLRRPMLSQYLGLDNSVGLTNVISGANSLRETLQIIEAQQIAITGAARSSPNENDTFFATMNGVKPIYCATAGPIPPNPGELAASDRMGALIAEARNYADFVLLDAPPLGVVGDAASMASKVDGVVFIIRLDRTSKKSIDTMERFIESVPCNVLGFVITNSGSSYAYESGYYYQ